MILFDEIIEVLAAPSPERTSTSDPPAAEAEGPGWDRFQGSDGPVESVRAALEKRRESRAAPENGTGL
jgi:hypothetical protein